MADNHPPLAKGVFFDKPHENAPSWIKGRISINVQKFIPFAQKYEKQTGYINLDINKKKDGSGFYVTLNTFVPKKADDGTAGINLDS